MVSSSRSRSRGRGRRSRSSSSYKGKNPSRSRTYSLRKRSRSFKPKPVVSKAIEAVGAGVSGDYIGSASKAVQTVQNFMYNRKARWRGFNGNSSMGPRFRPYNSKVSRKKTINGKLTPYGIAAKGVVFSLEERKTVQGDEAIAVGHTSLPVKYSALNFWRAMVKLLVQRIGCYIKDYGNIMINDGFLAGDQFRFYYFNTPVATSPAVATVDVLSGAAPSTFDSIAAKFAEIFDDLDCRDFRPESFVFAPNQSANSTYSECNLQCNTMKVAVATKSRLILQNVTVEVTSDNEADDVNNVPLTGKLFKCKGNNFMMKSNKHVLPGLMDPQNETVIAEGYSKQAGTAAAGSSVLYYAHDGLTNNEDTIFYKPADIPRDYDIQNFISSGPISLQPGEIRASQMNHTFEMTLYSYFELLYTSKASNNNTGPHWNSKLGYCQVAYFEKCVGKSPNANNKITLWVQNDFKQSVAIIAKNSHYTLPIQIQVDG